MEKIAKREKEVEFRKKKLIEHRKHILKEFEQIPKYENFKKKGETRSWFRESSCEGEFSSEPRQKNNFNFNCSMITSSKKERVDNFSRINESESWNRLVNDPLLTVLTTDCTLKRAIGSNPTVFLQLKSQINDTHERRKLFHETAH